MASDRKKAARNAFRERKLNAGVFAISCTGDGRRWIGAAADLAGAENRFRFTMKNGGGNSDLAAASAAHGAHSLAFEILERVDPEYPPVYLADHLKARAAHWREKLGAQNV